MDFSAFQKAEIALHRNLEAKKTVYPESLDFFTEEMCREACESIRQWKGYECTPLVSLKGLARELGVQSLLYKDESTRFGLGSFKALGGAYAVLQVLRRHLESILGEDVDTRDIREGKYAQLVEDVTVATATDGNHGRSVAWGAQLFGCKCAIYLHRGVSKGREEAIRKYDAEVVRVEGNYDDSVRQAEEDAKKNGWHIVSDTSYEGYTDLPRYVLAGYTVMIEEIFQQLPEEEKITHVFAQGGVGGLASAVFGALWMRFGKRRPRFIVVEPNLADCLYQSSIHGKPTAVEIEDETVMAGLSCGEVSLLSWEILKQCTDDFMTIPDDLVAPTMRLLAHGTYGDKPIVAGESAVAGVAGLIAARQNSDLAESLGLDANSRVLVIGTEGATDPAIYESIVGKAAYV